MPHAASVDGRRRLPAAIFVVAFLLRLSAGLLKGPDFVEEGYTFYAEIARTFWGGDGFCHAPNQECAVRMPFYPLLVSPFLAADLAYPWLIVLQALIGAVIPLIVWRLGSHLFDERVGLVAAAMAALNPYAVTHDPSFQETAIVNALIALAVLLLIKSARRDTWWLSVAAGCTLGLAALTTARVVPLVALVSIWVFTAGGSGTRLRRTCAVLVPVVLMLGAWTARNARVVGAPVLTTEAGLSLWIANHPVMMEVYPNGSVDQVQERALQLLGPRDRRRLESLKANPVAEDRELGRLAWQHIVANPGATARIAALKVLYAFAGWLSPARNWPLQLGYAAVFLPINALAIMGLWRSVRRGQAHVLVLLVFVALILTTAVFWSHTSHWSYLHGFQFIYAAAVVLDMWDRQRGHGQLSERV